MGRNVFDCLVMIKAVLNQIKIIKRDGKEEGGRTVKRSL